MEEKETIIETSKTASRNNKTFSFIRKKNFLITVLAIIVLTILEFTTDFIEITIGSLIELTNPLRPRSGTIWDLHQKDQIANEQLKEIRNTIPDQQEDIADIGDLGELRRILDEQQSVMIGAEQFRGLYNQIPTRFAYEIIPPFDLLKLAHSRKWIWTRITRGENSLAFHFLDGDKQFLMDTYPSFSVLSEISGGEHRTIVALDSIDIFIGRTISREQFFRVFDELSNSMKLRLINNPFLLVKWDRNIEKVGISRYAIGNIVTIGFQINQGIYNEVFSFEASDLAVHNFIERLNKLYPELNFAFPEGRYSEFPESN